MRQTSCIITVGVSYHESQASKRNADDRQGMLATPTRLNFAEAAVCKGPIMPRFLTYVNWHRDAAIESSQASCLELLSVNLPLSAKMHAGHSQSAPPVCHPWGGLQERPQPLGFDTELRRVRHPAVRVAISLLLVYENRGGLLQTTGNHAPRPDQCQHVLGKSRRECPLGVSWQRPRDSKSSWTIQTTLALRDSQSPRPKCRQRYDRSPMYCRANPHTPLVWVRDP